MRVRCIVAALALALAAASAGAAIDVYEFESAEEQRQFKRLVEELRCPKCLNTNLAGSDAPIAADLRRQVYRMVREGRTDAEIRRYLRERYGDFILYEPRLTPATTLLWFGPLVLLAIGAGVIVAILRRRRRAEGETAPLSADEQARIAAALAAAERDGEPDAGADRDGRAS